MVHQILFQDPRTYTNIYLNANGIIYYLLHALQVDGIHNINTLAFLGWRKTNGKLMSNIDLWVRIHTWIAKCQDVTFQHVRTQDHIPGNSLAQRLELRAAIKQHARFTV